MTNPYTEVLNACTCDASLTYDHIKIIDDLTHTSNKSFDANHTTMCAEIWRMVRNSTHFWSNIGLLMDQNNHYETKLQAFVLAHERVKIGWNLEIPENKTAFKSYLCREAQGYSIGSMTQSRKSIYRKINAIIVEILKYEWLGEWDSFFSDICGAMTIVDNAENYFDLMAVIFEEIFDDEEKLTIQEKKKMGEKITENYSKLEKIFETYLVPNEYSENLVKNAVLALQKLIQWIPSYFLYFGNIIEKLLNLLQINCPFRIDVLDSISLILESSAEMPGYIGKIYHRKRHIILLMLDQNDFQKNDQLRGKVLGIVIEFLKQQQKDITKHGEKIVFEEMSNKNDNKAILEKILHWLGNSKEDEENRLSVFRFVSTLSNLEEGETIFRQIVEMAPCPFNLDIFADKATFAIEVIEASPEMEEDRTTYKEIMKNVVKQQEEYFYSFLLSELKKYYDSSSSLQYLCKITWSFYYYYNSLSQPETKSRNKIFMMITQMMKIDMQASQQASLKILPIAHVHKLSTILRLGEISIGCIGKMIEDIEYLDLFVGFINKVFEEDNKVLKAALKMLCNCYDRLLPQARHSINENYLRLMKNRNGRAELDLIFVEALSLWSEKELENQVEGLEVLKKIIQFYHHQISKVTAKAIKGKPDFVKNQCEVIRECFEYIRILALALPYFKSDLIYEIDEDITFIMTTTTTICTLPINLEDYAPFYKAATSVLAARFEFLTQQQIDKNFHTLIAQAKEISNYILSELFKRPICEDIICSMLEYLGNFIRNLGSWNIPLETKVNEIQNIVNWVMNQTFNNATPGYIFFLESVVKSKNVHYLNENAIEIMKEIFTMLETENEHNVLLGLEMIHDLIKNSIDNPDLYSFVFNHFLSMSQMVCKAMIGENDSIKYIKEYSDLLYSMTAFVKNTKGQFNYEQSDNNLGEFYHTLLNSAKETYPAYSDHFLSKIGEFFGTLLMLSSNDDFSVKCRDLVVVLKRGY